MKACKVSGTMSYGHYDSCCVSAICIKALSNMIRSRSLGRRFHILELCSSYPMKTALLQLQIYCSYALYYSKINFAV